MKSVEDLIKYVTSNGKVCPNPIEWDRISRIIGVAKPGHECVPLILAGWTFSSDIQKRERLISQINYAKLLDEDTFRLFSDAIYALGVNDWYCTSEPLSGWQWDGT